MVLLSVENGKVKINKKDDLFDFDLWDSKKPREKCKFCLKYESLSCKIFDCVEKNNFLNDGKRTGAHLFLIKLTENRF